MLQNSKIAYDKNSKNKARKDRKLDDFYMILMTHILIMDIYLLARLFRTFNVDSKDKRKHPSNVQNAIIFAGGIHATNYEIFLQQVGFEEVYSVGNFRSDFNDVARYMNGDPPFRSDKEHQCLDISNMPNPLFE